MSEMRENGVRDVASNLQMYGVLAKKSFTHNSNKWAKRFFVLKDGFLFYYADSERKDFERHQVFNMHPKGVIPLGNCNIEPSTEPGHPFSIIIRNDTFSMDVMLAAESDYTREKWLTLLKRSSLV
ncbi:hypothetical protein NP493_116g05015 [Ridgeia piscesae]|uniref:PH domain-containing protein n=1 Tax=Ridgeia piscesae TaxID=27915 RepID=A0AAD9PGE0_RIDPI|nr:hypothetical protein NP493_116g05015 [Ridgeia piscesae]